MDQRDREDYAAASQTRCDKAVEKVGSGAVAALVYNKAEDPEKAKGNAAFRRGDYAAALTHYDTAIENAGCGAVAALFSNKAAALIELGKYDLSIQQCHNGLAAPGLSPELETKIYWRMGTAFESQEKFDESLKAFQKCALGPNVQEKLNDLRHKLSKESGSDWKQALPISLGVEQTNCSTNRLTSQTNVTVCESEAWESLEKRGDELLAAGKYQLAADAYEGAMQSKRKCVPPKELADLLANKGAAYLGDERPMDAFWNCGAALHVSPEHFKAALTMAKAHAKMAEYEKAKELLEKSSHTTRPEFQVEISRLNRLFREKQYGDYDLKSLLKEAAATKTPRLDHADYNGGVRVERISDPKGNRLIARRDFAPGDLLFVNKAVDVVYNSEVLDRTLVAGAEARDIRDVCASRIVRRFGRNKELVEEDLCEVFKAFEFEPLSERVVDIVSLNTLRFRDEQVDPSGHRDVLSFDAVRFGSAFGGCGVWLMAFLLGHSCVPNTRFFFVGDLMFVRAAKSIREGEALTVSYVFSSTNYKERQKMLDTFYGFQCDCALCLSDAKRIEDQPDLDSQRDTFRELWDQCMFDGKGDEKFLENVRKMAEDYSNRLAYKNRFDLNLLGTFTTLGAGCHGHRQFLKAAKAYEAAYFAAVGDGTQTNNTYSYNAQQRDAVFLCFNIANNYKLCGILCKANEYLRKLQRAAKTAWGSADKELLEMLFPDLPIKSVPLGHWNSFI